MTPAAANNLVLVGFVAVLVGTGLYQFARPLARFSERLDAIGSTTPTGEVEAARWKVVLYSAVFLLVVVAGLVMIGRGALFFL